jgi:hypothetical protein
MRDITLEFSNNGIKIPGLIPYTYAQQFSVPGLFNTPAFNIRTEYNPSSTKIKCYVNDQLMVSTTQSQFSVVGNTLGIHMPSSDYYGGIGTKDPDINLRSYQADNGQSISAADVKNPDIWDRLLSVIPWGKEIWNFVNVFFAIINPFNTYGNDLMGIELIPWWLSAMVDIIIIGIIAYGVQILRGN